MFLTKSSLLFTTLLLIFLAKLNPQNMQPEEVVQKQLEAYNQRDIEGFMSVIDDEVTFIDFSTNKTTLKGFKECKAYYTRLFKASPNLHSKILKRTIFDNKVIDHEYITGRNGNKEVTELVLIYEVANDKIIKVTVIAKPS